MRHFKPLASALLLALCLLPTAWADTVNSPEGAKLLAAKLAAVRKDSLQVSVKGPVKSLHIRHTDTRKGQKRTFFYSIQSYRNTDGLASYAFVLVEQTPKGLKDIEHGGSSSIYLFGDEDEHGHSPYFEVYKAINRYLKDSGAERQLKP